MEQTDLGQTVLSWEEMEEILVRHLPEKELAQVRNTMLQLTRDGGGAAFWKEHDPLTGMYNQTGFLKVLNKWKKECIDSGERLLLLCVDVDRLTNIKLIYGRSEGENAVRVLAQMIEDRIKGQEVCGRVDSGEFVIGMRTGDKDARLAYLFFRDLEKSLENYNKISGKEYSLHAVYSLWNGTLGKDTRMSGVLEQALAQRQKADGGLRHAMGDEKNWKEDSTERRLVKEVLDRNRLRYAYQPIVDAKSGDIYGYEALMRTEAEIFLSPLTILHYAEADNRFYDIEKATFFNVLGQMAKMSLGDRKIFMALRA